MSIKINIIIVKHVILNIKNMIFNTFVKNVDILVQILRQKNSQTIKNIIIIIYNKVTYLVN